MIPCMICKTANIGGQQIGAFNVYDCPRCGKWAEHPPKDFSTWPLHEQLDNGGQGQRRRSNLSHQIRHMQRSDGGYVAIPLDKLRMWGLDAPLPSPVEQTEKLVLWLGDNQPTPSSTIEVDPTMMGAWLGIAIGSDSRGLAWLLKQSEVQRYVEHTDGSGRMRLKYQGWQKFAELQNVRANSRVAFMAMKFGDEAVDQAFEISFRPAVAAAGFELRRLVDGQSAGCIDDQLRVALRTSRFVIADLSNGNQGAYWEAGFAEGLGKPVIYTCEAKVWEEEKTHFDTNHLVTVIWSIADLGKASTQLKSIIRATLPEEANLTD